MKIAVVAANGNIGARVVEELAKAGHEVVAMVREPSASDRPNIQASRVNLPSAFDAIEATRGVDALFWITPPNVQVHSFEHWYASCAEAANKAIRANDIKRIVHVSALGAGHRRHLGTVTFAGDVEQRLNEVAPNIVHLRPGYFMQNLLQQARTASGEGVLRLPFAKDHDIPWISASDIAATAVRYLIDASWAGQWTRNLMGPRNLKARELTNALSEAIGKPLHYEALALSDQRAILEGFGLHGLVLDELMELFAALADPDGVYATARTHEASTPTSIEDFARSEFAAAAQE